MDKPEHIRTATEADMTELFWHLWGDLGEDNDLGVLPNEMAVFEAVRAACTKDYSLAGIIDGPQGIMASIGIRAVTPWFSKQTILSQVWLFVAPFARKGTRIYDDLFRFAEWHRQDMSERVGYDMVLENSVLSFNRLPAKMRLWGRYGKQIGATYWARGDNGQDEHDIEQADRPGDNASL